jgi:cytochrome c biogenesis factor
MNAHLVSPWMSLHPPLIFVAYVAVLAPVGGAIEALAT